MSDKPAVKPIEVEVRERMQRFNERADASEKTAWEDFKFSAGFVLLPAALLAVVTALLYWGWNLLAG